jgi:hypothetical protein
MSSISRGDSQLLVLGVDFAWAMALSKQIPVRPEDLRSPNRSSVFPNSADM